MPVKALVRSAEVSHLSTRAGEFGLQGGEMLPDFTAIFARKDRIVEANSTGTGKMASRGVELIHGEGRLFSNHEVEVDGIRHTADSFVIATGARPAIPAIDGLQKAGYWTSFNAVFPDRQPESLVIIGGAAVGCEFAQIYSRLGTRVTIVESAGMLLPKADTEMGDALAQIFESEGIGFVLGATVTAVKTRGEEKVVNYRDAYNGQSIVADEVLVAAGRVPAIADLDLENAGVEVSGGSIVTDETLATNSANMWACGDVRGDLMHSHVATYEGTVAGMNCVSDPSGSLLRVDHSATPSVVFTDPPVSVVGLTEDEAVEQGREVRIGRARYIDTGRAEAIGETAGMVKVLADAESGEILGTHIVGSGSDMIIHEAVVSMGSHLGTEALLRPRVLHAHPTLSETLARAVAAAR